MGVGGSKDVEIPTMVWQTDNNRAEKGKGGRWKGSEIDNRGQRKREGSDRG